MLHWVFNPFFMFRVNMLIMSQVYLIMFSFQMYVIMFHFTLKAILTLRLLTGVRALSRFRRSRLTCIRSLSRFLLVFLRVRQVCHLIL